MADPGLDLEAPDWPAGYLTSHSLCGLQGYRSRGAEANAVAVPSDLGRQTGEVPLRGRTKAQADHAERQSQDHISIHYSRQRLVQDGG